MFIKIGLASLTAIITMTQAHSAWAQTHRFKPTVGYQTYKVRDPVLYIRPGDTVETNTLFSTIFVQKEGTWPGEVGPIFIEGATTNDTLAIKIKKYKKPYGF